MILNFRIAVDGVEISDINHDNSAKLYTADYTIAHGGDVIVSTLYDAENLKISIGIYTVPSNATLVVTTGQENVFAYGDNVTVFIQLLNDDTHEGITENITVVINNTPRTVKVINGEASFNITGFEPGQYDIMGIFNGSKYYNGPIYDSAIFEILFPDRILSIEVEDINYGEPTIINITVTDSEGNKEKGTVILNISGLEIVVMVDGNKSVEIADLPIGSYTINATLIAEKLEAEVVNDTETFTVSKAASTIEIDGTEAITTVENATVIVTVGPEGVTGTVNITVDGESYGEPVELIDGVAIIDIAELVNGTHTITAQYNGDVNYNASEVVEMEVVVSLTPTSMEIETIDAVYGDTAYVIVSGLPEDATGTITATIGGKTFEGDAEIGIIEVTGLAADDYVLFDVEYSGDAIYNASFGMASLEIIPADSSVEIEEIDSVTYPGDVEVTFTVENETVVTVNVFDADTKEITEGIVIEDGKVIISGLDAGEYTIMISNDADENHTGSFDIASFNILKASTTIEPKATGDLVVDGEVNVTFTVPTDIDGILIVTIDGEEVTGFTVDDGKVIIRGTYDAGKHTVVATLTDDTNYENTVGSLTFDIAKIYSEIFN